MRHTRSNLSEADFFHEHGQSDSDFRGPEGLPENPTCVSLTVPRLKCHTVTTANVNKWRWGRVGNGQKPKLTNHRKDTKL